MPRGRTNVESAGLTARVRGLIKWSHRGSVNAAARTIGIPQRTLARIVDGTTPSPRADTLQALANYYDTSIDWLFTGEGRGPPRDEASIPWAEVKAWDEIQRALNLSPPSAQAVRDLPWALWRHMDHTWPDGMSGQATPNVQIAAGLQEGHRKVIAGYCDAYRDWIQRKGVEAVRQALVQSVTEAQLGFNAVAITLLHREKIDPKEIERIATGEDLRDMLRRAESRNTGKESRNAKEEKPANAG